jgi:DnaJ-class molecular chaperone
VSVNAHLEVGITIDCPECGGEGFVTMFQNSAHHLQERCGRCGGVGTIPDPSDEELESFAAQFDGDETLTVMDISPDNIVDGDDFPF